MKTLQYYFFVPVLLALLSLSSCYNYYYIVRHAEKATPPSNPDTQTPLTPAGRDRAEALCDTLRSKNIGKIFESQYVRTQQTAEPTQTALGITPVQYNNPAGTADLVTQLRATTSNVLVVGHTNNIPGIIEGLTGGAVPAADIVIPDSDYDNLFVVRRNRCKNPDRYTLYRRTYGLPSP
ncbi:MAG: histidine phosphatase family protein [Saprospirales bacterium]|jgi:phosphohistidine phosphatase SixA|nr:histidine phosphatase family protein [Saprospirales bacterium]